MAKKGKQKQAGQATPESAPPFVQSTQPLPEIPESREEEAFLPTGHSISPLGDDWGTGDGGMQYGHEDQEEVKPVQLKTPVSASAMASKTNSTSAHTELADAVAAAFANRSGGEKTAKATKGSKGESSKTENKGGVSWDDGRWDDNPGGKDRSRNHTWGDRWAGNPGGLERHQADDTWGASEHHVDDNEWDDTGGDYEEWEGAQGEPSGVSKNDDDWEQHRHQTTPAISYSSQWPQPAPPPKPQQLAPAAWMLWGDEARQSSKVTYLPTSSQNDPHAAWGPSSYGEQSWNQAGPSTKHAQQNGQAWHATSKAGPSQKGPNWGNNSAKAEQTPRTEYTWYTKTGYSNQKTPKSSQQPDSSKSGGRRGRKDKEEHGDRRGRSQRRSGGWADKWGRDPSDDENEWEHDGDDRNRRDEWNRSGSEWGKGLDGNDWNKSGDDWGNDWNKSGTGRGNDWNKSGTGWGNDWDKSGDDYNKSTNDWDKGGSWGGDWDGGRGNDRSNDWGGNQNDDDDESWDRRVHFTPKLNVSSPIGPTYSMPSKTMAHAYSSLPSDFPRGPMQNSMNEFADVRFMESRGAALAPVENALFGRARPAKERIHWMFPHDKDQRVASLLSWIQRVSYGLAGFGLHKFLQTRERGALFANASYHADNMATEPTFDWLTYDQLQITRDRTLQESVGFHDPALQVIVFVFLPSKSGNSVAIWRRKLKVPNNLRLAYQYEITQAIAALRKNYVVHVDELPKEVRPTKPSKAKKPKRKWWQIFG